MESPMHSMSTLFAQLGLPSDPAGIQRFIAEHATLPAQIPLAEAPFWNTAQASFLREEVMADADWAGIVDQLDQSLREHH